MLPENNQSTTIVIKTSVLRIGENPVSIRLAKDPEIPGNQVHPRKQRLPGCVYLRQILYHERFNNDRISLMRVRWGNTRAIY